MRAGEWIKLSALGDARSLCGGYVVERDPFRRRFSLRGARCDCHGERFAPRRPLFGQLLYRRTGMLAHGTAVLSCGGGESSPAGGGCLVHQAERHLVGAVILGGVQEWYIRQKDDLAAMLLYVTCGEVFFCSAGASTPVLSEARARAPRS
mmetsp:Transcript_114106/g.327827  ORF Transcript_114106/g.327827 Transcript_114106/m.327827 type:complete len:150 (-) Transcript_114106:48-497(-)